MTTVEFLAAITAFAAEYERTNDGAVCGVIVRSIEQVRDDIRGCYSWDGEKLDELGYDTHVQSQVRDLGVPVNP